MTRFIVSIAIFAILSAGVGLLLGGNEEFDWGIALSLFGIALIGEGIRVWIRRSRTKSGQSSGI